MSIKKILSLFFSLSIFFYSEFISAGAISINNYATNRYFVKYDSKCGIGWFPAGENDFQEIGASPEVVNLGILGRHAAWGNFYKTHPNCAITNIRIYDGKKSGPIFTLGGDFTNYSYVGLKISVDRSPGREGEVVISDVDSKKE